MGIVRMYREVDRMIRILLSRKLGEMRISQAELSRMTGIRPNTISYMYNEMCSKIDLEQLDLICEALNCDIIDLLERIPSPIPLIDRTRAGNKKKS